MKLAQKGIQLEAAWKTPQLSLFRVMFTAFVPAAGNHYARCNPCGVGCGGLEG
jgi:hypothetical protein